MSDATDSPIEPALLQEWLRETVAAAQTKKATEPTFDGLKEIWLPGQDSNLRQGG